MALRQIRLEGDPILRQVSKPIKEFTPFLCQLLDDMKETLVYNKGVGLAAPQIGIIKRVIIVERGENDYLELINPTIVSSSGCAVGEEGCLSVKNRFGYVKRPTEIKVEAFDRTGKAIEVTAKDYLARVICHEIDHLEGILFVDKMEKGKQ